MTVTRSIKKNRRGHRGAWSAGPVAGAALGTLMAGCAGLPPGADFPRHASTALAHPEVTRLGSQYGAAAAEHVDASGFSILNVGVDGFLTRVQLIDAAEQSLDLQYFIFRGDETGRLITAALLRAADRGVHIRVLVDDGDTLAGDEQILALDAHPAIEVRVFNPFGYRGHAALLRSVDFLFNIRRLDYRMHNKMLVADNAVALIGGRNIGKQYFQMDPQSQFADDDLFSVGPVVTQLSATFDDFWNSALSIPAAALGTGHLAAENLARHRDLARGSNPLLALDSQGIDYAAMLASDEPLASLVSGRTPLVWAHAQVIADSPEKKAVLSGARQGRLMALSVEQAASRVQDELLMITPYFIPSPDEMLLLDTLLRRNVRVALLTNSLSSAPELVAQAGYAHYRGPMLNDGADLYEVRALIGRRRGSGQTTRISSFGNFGLHAKVFIFDRQRLFLGSMNFDRRSRRLNTEIGVIIDSPELARQMVTRFDDLTRPENVYEVGSRGLYAGGGIVWDTVEHGRQVEFRDEPARSVWQRLRMKFLEWVPFGDEL